MRHALAALILVSVSAYLQQVVTHCRAEGAGGSVYPAEREPLPDLTPDRVALIQHTIREQIPAGDGGPLTDAERAAPTLEGGMPQPTWTQGLLCSRPLLRRSTLIDLVLHRRLLLREEHVVMLAGIVIAHAPQLTGTLEMRVDVARHQLVVPLRVRPVRPIVREF